MELHKKVQKKKYFIGALIIDFLRFIIDIFHTRRLVFKVPRKMKILPKFSVSNAETKSEIGDTKM